ncbi:hypothetical protein OAB97_01935 [Candidatus Pelagibacter sp.]|nr:hypothetical protein [Candidatus Pelagibacter sp.]
MSAVKIATTETQNLAHGSLATPKETKNNSPRRVDINNLLARVREEKKKENKINLVFFSLFASLIFVVGLILSF